MSDLGRRRATLSDWELWACANRMIEEHGRDAAIHAGMRADRLFEKGDIDGSATWLEILRRIDSMLTIPAGQLH